MGFKFVTDGEFRRRSYHSFFYGAASPVRANSVGAANRIDAQLPERAVEKAVIGAATKFAIGDKFEAQSLLQPDRIGNGGIFGGGERGRVDLALGKAGAFRAANWPDAADCRYVRRGMAV